MKDTDYRGLSTEDVTAPLPGITLSNCARYLPLKSETYEAWATVGRALHHQFQGAEDALRLFNSWSKTQRGYVDYADCAAAWRTFAKLSPVSFSELIFRYGGDTASLRARPPEDLQAFLAGIPRATTRRELLSFGMDPDYANYTPLGEIANRVNEALAALPAALHDQVYWEVQEVDLWPNKGGIDRTKRTVLRAYYMGGETDEEFEARKEKLLREHIARIKQEKAQLKMFMKKYNIPATDPLTRVTYVVRYMTDALSAVNWGNEYEC